MPRNRAILTLQPKPMKGFGGASVLEIVSDYRGDTWRAVYTILFHEAVYVLHAFQKKSKRGIATPKQEIEVIKRRLAEAERLHRERQNCYEDKDQQSNQSRKEQRQYFCRSRLAASRSGAPESKTDAGDL